MPIKKTSLILFIALVVLSQTAYSEKINYSISNIPEHLLENANSVVRYNYKRLTIESNAKVNIRHRNAVTILNSKADQQAFFYSLYSKLSKADIIYIKIYDKFGNLVKNVKRSEIMDYSAVSGFSLYEDTRVKVYQPQVKNYPFTIEYEVEKSYATNFFTINWQPILAFNQSLEYSGFELIYNKKYSCRIKEKNLPDNVQKTENETGRVKKWELKNVKAYDKCSFSPRLSDIVPIVYFAPDSFEFKGLSGEMNSWEYLSSWFYELNEGLNDLSDEAKSDIRNLVKDCANKIDTIKTLYNYLQQNTRYVSIQIGIGGIQPFPSSTVEKYGYGDCKALSHYMMSILDCVGIESIYTLIRAGKYAKEVMEDFPNDQFNHAILCVPFESDTIWLECTSQTNPFGYQGYFTDNRKALLVMEEGGKLVSTNTYAATLNRQVRSSSVLIDELGNARVDVSTTYGGQQYEYVDELLNSSEKDQRKLLNESLELNNFSIVDFELTQEKDIIPSAVLDLNITISKYGVKTGKRMFLPLNLLNRRNYRTNNKKEREIDFDYRACYYDADTITYTLPDNFRVEFLPENVEYKSEIGEYKTKIQVEDNKLTYIRIQKMQKGRFPAERYAEFVDFFKKINKADNAKAVLVKKEI